MQGWYFVFIIFKVGNRFKLDNTYFNYLANVLLATTLHCNWMELWLQLCIWKRECESQIWMIKTSKGYFQVEPSKLFPAFFLSSYIQGITNEIFWNFIIPFYVFTAYLSTVTLIKRSITFVWVCQKSEWWFPFQPVLCLTGVPNLQPWDFPGKRTGVGCHCLLPQ